MPNAQSDRIDARPSLYKYVSRHVGELILKNRTLRWSTPGTLNDPYDMQFDLRLDLDKEAVKATALGKLWAAFYSSEPVQAGTRFGAAIKLLRAQFPQLNKEEFNQHLGKAIDEISCSHRRCPSRSAKGFASPFGNLQDSCASQVRQTNCSCGIATPSKAVAWYSGSRTHRASIARGAGHVASVLREYASLGG